jgi:hypothetical protein
MSNIHNRAMLVSLKLSKWTATKYDRKISAEVAASHNAAQDLGRYNKRLIPKGNNSYANLITAFGALYAEHTQQTLPWTDEGWRLIPMKNYQKYVDMVRTRRVEIETLIDEFISDYPAIKADMKQKANGLFNEADWPEPVDLKKRFSVRAIFNPVPAGQDFRVEMDSASLETLTREADERVKQAVEEAQRNAAERLYGCVQRIAERLADPKNIIRSSLIDNARDVTDVLTRLNVTEDPRLEALRLRVEELAAVSPEALRTLPMQRESTAAEADSILDEMKAVFGGLSAA